MRYYFRKCRRSEIVGWILEVGQILSPFWAWATLLIAVRLFLTGILNIDYAPVWMRGIQNISNTDPFFMPFSSRMWGKVDTFPHNQWTTSSASNSGTEWMFGLLTLSTSGRISFIVVSPTMPAWFWLSKTLCNKFKNNPMLNKKCADALVSRARSVLIFPIAWLIVYLDCRKVGLKANCISSINRAVLRSSGSFVEGGCLLWPYC